MLAEYRTLEAELEHEPPKIKGSRFIARVGPAASVEEATALVGRARAKYHDARHHCFAYRLGAGRDTFRTSDDGEPGGSGGRPILQQIDGLRLLRTAVVVSRYFGGIKLGVGGLVRAYGGAAAEALRIATIRVVPITRRVTVTYAYVSSNAVQTAMAAAGLEPAASRYDEEICLEFDVPLAAVDAFVADVQNRTGGQAGVTLGEETEL